MNRNSIIIIGPIPPPIGGVSVHVSRLVNKLKNNWNILIINTTKIEFLQGIRILKILIVSLFKLTKFIIHNHIFRIRFNYFIVLLSKIFRIKYVQTFHSFRVDTDKLSRIEIRLFKYIIRNSYKIIAVNDDIRNRIIEFDNTALQKIYVIPAFLPYNEKYTQLEREQYLKSLQINDFINSHYLILCANAYRIAFYNDEDLYGIDLCIELMIKLKNLIKRDVGLVFMLPQVGNKEYFDILRKRIVEYGIEGDFIFINKEVDLVPLFEYVDIFLRPTNTDGDALSIREALYEGVPTIASDVVTRPLGTILFKTRDISDLLAKVINVIENLDNERKQAKKFGKKQNDFIEKYNWIYSENLDHK